METTPADRTSIGNYAIKFGFFFAVVVAGCLCIRLIGCAPELVLGRIIGIAGSGIVLYLLWIALYVIFNSGIATWRKRGDIAAVVAQDGEKIFSSKLTWGVLAVVAIILLGAIFGVLIYGKLSELPQEQRAVPAISHQKTPRVDAQAQEKWKKDMEKHFAGKPSSPGETAEYILSHPMPAQND